LNDPGIERKRIQGGLKPLTQQSSKTSEKHKKSPNSKIHEP
jgi:hypothetical protein